MRPLDRMLGRISCIPLSMSHTCQTFSFDFSCMVEIELDNVYNN